MGSAEPCLKIAPNGHRVVSVQPGLVAGVRMEVVMMSLIEILGTVNKSCSEDFRNIKTESWGPNSGSHKKIVLRQGGYPLYWVYEWRISVAGLTKNEARRLANLLPEKIKVFVVETEETPLMPGGRLGLPEVPRDSGKDAVLFEDEEGATYSVPERLLLEVRNFESKHMRLLCSPDFGDEDHPGEFRYTDREEEIRPSWCTGADFEVSCNGGAVFANLIMYGSPNYTSDKPGIIRAQFEDVGEGFKLIESHKW